jgi:hypothetical protein
MLAAELANPAEGGEIGDSESKDALPRGFGLANPNRGRIGSNLG